MKHNKNTTLLVFLLHFRLFNILYCQNRLIQNKNRNFVAQVRCRKALTANLDNEINLTHKIKYQTIMKKYAAIALSLFTAIAFTSCKSQESAYKKAYEKAKQQQTVEQQQPQQTTVAVQPTQPATTVTTTPAPTHADANVRSESVQLIDGAGLKTYSVVCGSFSLKANAQGLQQKLKNQGYEAQIALNPQRKFYRVIATTFDDLSSAVSSRNKLRNSYSDAWLLYNK